MSSTPSNQLETSSSPSGSDNGNGSIEEITQLVEAVRGPSTGVVHIRTGHPEIDPLLLGSNVKEVAKSIYKMVEDRRSKVLDILRKRCGQSTCN